MFLAVVLPVFLHMRKEKHEKHEIDSVKIFPN